jgi:four helix bundle protein
MRQFVRIARGSLIEHKNWFQKAINRNLITKEFYDYLFTRSNILSLKINNYLKALDNKIKPQQNNK